MKNLKHHAAGIMFIAIFAALALGSTASTPAPTQQQGSQTATQQQAAPRSVQVAQATPSPQSSSQYWTGNGGRGMRLGILLPHSQGLNENQDYLSAMIQGRLVSNISTYSAISVLDRVSLDRVIAETLDPTYEDDWDIVKIGRAHV